MDRDRRRKEDENYSSTQRVPARLNSRTYFFFREERSETPANEGFVAASILHDVRPRIKGRKNNNINKIQIK